MQGNSHLLSIADSGSLEKSSFTILEELTVSPKDLEEEDLISYAKSIGIDPEIEKDFLWVAEEGILADLPENWIAVEDSFSRIFYYNKDTHQSRWDHPLDAYYKSLVKQQRLKRFLIPSPMASKKPQTLANLRFLDEHVSFSFLEKKEETKLSKNLLQSNQKDNNDNDSNGFTLTSLGDDEEEDIESVQFELDENAFKGMSLDDDDDDDEEATLDVTEGGMSDVKRFTEIYTEDLENEDKRNVSTNKTVTSDIGKDLPDKSKVKLSQLRQEPVNIDKGASSDESFSLKSIDKDPFEGNNDLFSSDKSKLSKLNNKLQSLQSNDLRKLPQNRAEESSRGRIHGPLEPLSEEREEKIERIERPKSAAANRRASSGREKSKSSFPEIEDDNSMKDTHLIHFDSLSEKLRSEMNQLRKEILEVIKSEKELLEENHSKDIEKCLQRLDIQEKELERVKNDQKTSKRSTDQSSGNKDEIANIAKSIQKFEKRIDKLEERPHEASLQKLSKNYEELRKDFKNNGNEMMEFKKENDLNIRAIRKQLSHLSGGQEKVENRCEKVEKSLERINKQMDKIMEGNQKEIGVALDRLKNSDENQKKQLSSMVEVAAKKISSEMKKIEDNVDDKYGQLSSHQKRISKNIQDIENDLKEMRIDLKATDSKIRGQNSQDSSSSKSNDKNGTKIEERLGSVETGLNKVLSKLEVFSNPDDLKKKKKYDNNQSRSDFKSLQPESGDSSYHGSGSPSSSLSSLERSKRRTERFRFRRRGGKSERYSPVDRFSSYDFRNHYHNISPINYASHPQDRLRAISSSSASLLAMIRRTSKLLRDETLDIDSIGNYKFMSDMSSVGVLRRETNSDESAIRKLAQIRHDIDERLKKLDTLISRREHLM
ncbi:uncharacterized protein LOC141851579 [Brevipalpus obovatus]|uniref:uncharacterized protein LOC141851579 n=1 Tax=Brevipalpus obovatus TaxID=246614 RepID=UPI003D9F0640